MTLQFSTKHIAYALSTLWKNSDLYKFKFAVNQQLSENPDLEYMHTLDVPEQVLIDVFSAVTVEPEGVASSINHAMEDSLLTQLNAASNLSDVQAGTAEPNEAARLLIAIGKINDANQAVLQQKIDAGLAQILA